MALLTDAPLHLQHPVVRPGTEARRVNMNQPLSCLRISAQGMMAIGTHRGMISLRDAQTGQEQIRLGGHRRRVHDLVFTPDGQTLYSVGRDGALFRWSVATKEGEQVWRGRLSLNACDTNGLRTLAGGDDGIIRCWLDNHLEIELHGHHGMVTTLALLPDGARAISGGVDGMLILWDLGAGHGRRLFRHEKAVTCCDLSPDGQLLLVGSTDGTLVVWDLQRGRAVGALTGHDGPVTACAFSADGRMALSGSSDRTVMVWDVDTGGQINTFYSHDREIISVAWSSSYVWSAAADRTARAWDLFEQPSPPEYRLRHIDGISDLALLPNNQHLVSASLDYTLRVWNTTDGSCLQTLHGHHGAVRNIAFSAGGRGMVSVANDGEIRLWSWEHEQWQPGRVLSSGEPTLSRCVFMGAGILLTGGLEGTLRAWSLLDGSLLFDFVAHNDEILGCTILADDRIVTAGGQGDVAVWAAGQLERRLQISDRAITACHRLPNGEGVVLSSKDGCVRHWMLDERPPVVLYRHDGAVNDLDVASSGEIISVGEDRTLRIHDRHTNKTTQQTLSWPLNTVTAQDHRVVVGDRAGNIWVFAQ